jgi:plasmid stabilization system protein ParE
VSYRLRVSRRAGRQIRAAAAWWQDHRDKAPRAFTEDLDDAIRFVAEVPLAGQPVRHSRLASVRRVLLTRTRYQVYYSIDERAGTVEILALWHTSRGESPSL